MWRHSYISFELAFRLASMIDGLLWLAERFVALALWRSSTSRCSVVFPCSLWRCWPTGVSVRILDGLSSGIDLSILVLRTFPDLGGRRLFWMGVLEGGNSDEGERFRKYLPVGNGIRLFWLPPFFARAICGWKT